MGVMHVMRMRRGNWHLRAVAVVAFWAAMMSAEFSSAVAEQAGVRLPEARWEVRTLPNGLTVILEPDKAAPVVSLQGWVGTGSIHEGRWLGAGLSHILEHMLFKGTPTRGSGRIAREIQDLGGYINAYTTFDRTVYWIDVPSAGALEALEILMDALMNAALPEEEYAKEQEVIRREIAMGQDDPGRQSVQLLLRTLYPNSPYGIPVIGYLDVFNQLTREDVLRYYKERYVPNNITLVVSGDFEAGAVMERVEKFFGGIPRAPLPPVLVPQEPPQIGRRDAHEEFPTELSRMFLAWRVPGLDHPDAAALEMLASVLGSGRSSVLNLEVRERRKLAHGISAGVYSTQKEGVFYVSALCDPDKRGAVEEAVLELVRKAEREGVDGGELEKARRGMLSDLIGGQETAQGRASSLGSDWFLTRNLNFSREFLRRVEEVSVEDVKRVAGRYLRADTVTSTSLNPKGSLAGGAQRAGQFARGEIRKFELRNGLRVVVQEDGRLPLVAMTMAFRGGVLAETPKNNGVTQLVAAVLPKGTATRNAEEIARTIEGVGGSIGAEAGNNSYSVSVQVLAPDARLGMEVLADVALRAAFPEAEVELEKQSQLAAIKAEEDQIVSVARNALREVMYGSHPYAMPQLGRRETVEGLKREDLAAFHQAHAVARNAVLAVFGDVKAEEVLRWAEEMFGRMEPGELALAAPAEPKFPEAAVEEQRFMDKQQAVLMAGYPGAAVLDEDRPVLEIVASASSDLGSRFFDRIREQMGLAYFVGAAQMVGLARGFFAFYLGTDPAKAGEVEAALRDEIGKLAEEGLTEEELERAKQKILGQEAMRQQSIGSRARVSALNELQGLGYDHHLRREREIRGVTLERVREVARRHFAESAPVMVRVMPKAPQQADAEGPNENSPEAKESSGS